MPSPDNEVTRDQNPSVRSGTTISLPPEVPETAPGLPSIPGYEILQEIGRGGMGVVYQARQLGLGRIVALKMLLSGGHAADEEREQLQNEARTIARLQHPHIVQIYEIGSHEGHAYLTMEYVPGRNLAQRLAGDPLPPLDAARLLEVIARTVAATHQEQIVHRDLKPANILIAETGAVTLPEGAARMTLLPLTTGGNKGDHPAASSIRQIQCVPKISDFGLAKRLDEAGLTATGTVLGTPAYMAPEQARGHSRNVGAGADIYSLGAILYELLTGRPPFKAASALETILQVLEQEPVSPRRLQPSVPADLETICLKCLEKYPARRYDSALAVANDLERFLQGRPILARPPSTLYVAHKFARRHWRPLATAAAVLLLILVGTVAAFLSIDQARQEALQAKQGAEQEKEAAIEARDRVQELLSLSKIALARSDYEAGKMLSARRRLEECTPSSRGWEWHYLNRITNLEMFQLTGHDKPVNALQYSPDGRWLASADSSGTVYLWTPPDAGARHILKGDDRPLRKLQFTPDGRCLGFIRGADTVEVWDVESGQRRLKWQTLLNDIRGFSFAPDGRQLYVTGSQEKKGEIDHVDIETQQWSRWQTLDTPLRDLAMSLDGKWLVGCEAGRWLSLDLSKLTVWKVSTQQPVMQLTAPGVQTLAYHRRLNRLVAGGERELQFYLQDATTGMLTAQAVSAGGIVGENYLSGVQLSVRGDVAVTLEQEGYLAFRHPKTTPYALVLDVINPGEYVDGAIRGAFDDHIPDNVVTTEVRYDKTDYFRWHHNQWLSQNLRSKWRWVSGASLRVGPRSPQVVTMAPDSSHVVTAANDGSLHFWPVYQTNPTSWICADIRQPKELHFCGADCLIVQELNGQIHAYNPLSDRVLYSLPMGGDNVPPTPAGQNSRGLRVEYGTNARSAVSPDRRWLVALQPLRDDGPVQPAKTKVVFWDLQTRKPKYQRAVTDVILSLAIRGDGQGIALYTRTGDLQLWNADGQIVWTRHALGVTCLTALPGSNLIAVGTSTGRVHVIDTDSQAEVQQWRADEGPIRQVVPFPDGTRLLTVAENSHECRIWQRTNGQEVLTLPDRNNERIQHVAISPDGHRVVTVSSGINCWDVATGHLTMTLRNESSIRSIAFNEDGTTLAVGHEFGLTLFEARGAAGRATLDLCRRVAQLREQFACHESALLSLERDPGLTPAQRQEAQLWFRGQFPEQAEQSASIARVLNAANETPTVYQACRDVLRRMRQDAPADVRLRVLEATALHRLGHDQEALTLLSADGNKPTSEDWQLWCHLLLLLKQFRPAVELYQQMQSSPGTDTPWITPIKAAFAQGLSVHSVTYRRAEKQTFATLEAHLDKVEPSIAESMEVRAYLDRVPITVQPVLKQQDKKLVAVWRDVPVGAGLYQQFEVTAHLHKSPVVLDRAARHLEPGGRPEVANRPRIHLLLIGAGRFTDAEITELKATQDCERVQRTFLQGSAEFYQPGEVQILSDRRATGAAVEKALADLETRLATVAPDDLLVVFVAGHGFKDANSDLQYPLSDYSSVKREQTSLRWSRLRTLGKARCRTLFLLDCCHSGQAVEFEKAQGVDALPAARVLLFTACQAEQKSIENAKGGVFTGALLKGLLGAADLNGDQIVDEAELVAHLREINPHVEGAAAQKEAGLVQLPGVWPDHRQRQPAHWTETLFGKEQKPNFWPAQRAPGYLPLTQIAKKAAPMREK